MTPGGAAVPFLSKEMFVIMPVINCKAGLASDKEEKNIYICPTYCVPTRRPHYVFPA